MSKRRLPARAGSPELKASPCLLALGGREPPEWSDVATKAGRGIGWRAAIVLAGALLAASSASASVVVKGPLIVEVGSDGECKVGPEPGSWLCVISNAAHVR
ncbi:MAG TPA: hypothetical protein VI997_06390, partial [Candidatus Thermoplasmatota archaeon]|nr:hypothetical protein [Candidatus Thermoplasmatota archaeon]